MSLVLCDRKVRNRPWLFPLVSSRDVSSAHECILDDQSPKYRDIRVLASKIAMKGFAGAFLVLVSLSCPEEVSRIGCTDGDVNYEEGEPWKRRASVTCTCETGLPLCISIQCRDPVCSNPITLPDQCCPTCPTVGLSQGNLMYAVQVCFL